MYTFSSENIWYCQHMSSAEMTGSPVRIHYTTRNELEFSVMQGVFRELLERWQLDGYNKHKAFLLGKQSGKVKTRRD